MEPEITVTIGQPTIMVQDEMLLAHALDAASEAIVLCDPDGAILIWNAQAARLYGWAPTTAVGVDLDLLLDTMPATCNDDLAGYLSRAEPWRGALVRRTAHGALRRVEIHRTIGRAANGSIAWISETSRALDDSSLV